MRIKPLKLNIPPFKLRTEQETLNILHRYKVVSRLREIKSLNEDIKPQIEHANYLKELGKQFIKSREIKFLW